MHTLSSSVRILVLSLAAAFLAAAQAPKPGPDTLTLTSGEKLTGHFVRSTGSNVTFKSDGLGEVTIDWNKVRELETNANVAVIRKGVRLRRKRLAASIPQGKLSMQDQKLQVAPAAPAAPQSIPVSDSAVVLDQAAFQKALTHTPGIFSDWAGTLTAGATFVDATQKNRTFTSAVALVRAEPTEDWLDRSYRTLINFSQSYGRLSEPGAVVKTSIYHAAIEQDEYFSASLFGFGQADFDHNFSQGLDLQQTYNGGIGWTAVKDAMQELDLKGSASYIRQAFLPSPNGITPPSQSLIGSVFAEHYQRKLPHSARLDQTLSVTPAWNNTNAYSAAFGTLVSIPVYKHLSGSAGVIDTFLNNPPPGFRKNSFQFTLGVTYTLQ